MPIVDYKCHKCSNEFFELVKNTSEKRNCPKCGSEDTEKVYKGKYYGKNGGGCSGSCSGCSGCH